jgi:NAD(P)H dehydrogenase (quinone)
MTYVPLGFPNSQRFDNTEVVGGSAFGAGTAINSDSTRPISKKELNIAHTQGENLAKIVTTCNAETFL